MTNQPNKRDFFRLHLYGVDCTYRVLEINGDPPQGQITGKGTINDISGGGMNLACKDEFPLMDNVLLEITFNLDNEPFVVMARINRSLETPTSFQYGLEYFEMGESLRRRLIATLNRLQTRRRH